MICSKCLKIHYDGKPTSLTIEEMIALDKKVKHPMSTYHSYNNLILPTLRNHGGCERCIKNVEAYLND